MKDCVSVKSSSIASLVGLMKLKSTLGAVAEEVLLLLLLSIFLFVDFFKMFSKKEMFFNPNGLADGGESVTAGGGVCIGVAVLELELALELELLESTEFIML